MSFYLQGWGGVRNKQVKKDNNLRTYHIYFIQYNFFFPGVTPSEVEKLKSVILLTGQLDRNIERARNKKRFGSIIIIKHAKAF